MVRSRHRVAACLAAVVALASCGRAAGPGAGDHAASPPALQTQDETGQTQNEWDLSVTGAASGPDAIDAGALGAQPSKVVGTLDGSAATASTPRIEVPGLPKPMELGTTSVATAIDSAGVVAVFAEPDASAEPAWELAIPTEFGGPRHFAILDEATAPDGTPWLQVQVPVRPNGSVGWLPRDAVTIEPVTTRILVDLSDRSVVVWDGDDVVLDTTGAIGAPATPTPTGTYYIRDKFPWDPESVYGPWVFALSSYSETIDQINGGDAVVAIHGTRNNSVLGQAASLGCIRLDNDTLEQLAALVDVGTPVEVQP